MQAVILMLHLVWDFLDMKEDSPFTDGALEDGAAEACGCMLCCRPVEEGGQGDRVRVPVGPVSNTQPRTYVFPRCAADSQLPCMIMALIIRIGRLHWSSKATQRFRLLQTEVMCRG